jgi:hypothetical protein
LQVLGEPLNAKKGKAGELHSPYSFASSIFFSMILIARISRLAGLLIALLIFACEQSPAPQDAKKSEPDSQASQGAKSGNMQKNIVIDKARLVAAAKAGGEYLLRMQKSDGSFHYYYDPAKDLFDQRRYNILRHAGTAYSLFQLYEATRETRYLEAAQKAMRFLKTRYRTSAHIKNAIYVLDFDGKAKLGANGLALIATVKQLELDAKNASSEDARRLANMILALQRKDGSFKSYHTVRGDEPEGSVSLYYPGEAILGLAGLYNLDKEGRWLEAAQRAADFLIESQRQFHELPPDAWLMQALEALYKIKANQRLLSHALALAEAMIARQYGEEESGEWAGGFAPGEPRATPAASRSEGILAVYRMAKPLNDPLVTRLANALQLAARFQLSQQFGDHNRFALPNPRRALGGFRESLSETRIRIDFVQHNISSLLGVAEALY